MSLRRTTSVSVSLSLVVVVCSLLLIGCGSGGGGGGSQNTVHPNRSYRFVSADGSQSVAVSIDTDYRYTVCAYDRTQLAGGIAAQGTIDSATGELSASSPDGAVSFSGRVDPGAGSITGTVRRNSSALIGFTAGYVASKGAMSSTLSGSYRASTGGRSAYLTVTTSGQAALWVTNGTLSWGGLVTVTADGTLASDDGTFAGQLTAAGSGATLTVTRLDGTAISLTLSVTKLARAKWTFLVYLDAANNLQQYAALNVNQMETVGSTSDVNIVVQWKQANCGDCGSPDWVGTRRYYVTKDSGSSAITSTVVQDLGTGVDMGDYRTLQKFIQWGETSYPADHYAVVLWDHGSGWIPTRAPGVSRAVSIDSSTGNEIETWQLPSALAVTPKVDMVIFDACLLEMEEVLYEMRNSTSVVVGSEEDTPVYGYYYNTFLSDLAADPSMTPAEFGTAIVNRTLQAYGYSADNTQSAVDETKVADVATKLDAFGTALTNDSKTNASDAAIFAYARNNADYYAYPYNDNKDLWNYADLIRTHSTSPALQSAAAAVQSAIESAVIAEAHGALHANSHGIAIYVPSRPTYLSYASYYTNLALARVTSWPTWLQSQP